MQSTALRRSFLAALVATAGCGSSSKPVAPVAPAAAAPGPVFGADGALAPPADYRSWVFLTAGFGMSYGPVGQAAAAGGVELLDNVYVTPAAYQGFLATGVWPEHTMFVLEIRNAEGTGSIVTRGRYQTDLAGMEAAVKDSARFAGGWAYFGFDTDRHGATAAAPPLPQDASCYGCHRASGAVEQTFTQFYPTLFEVARARGTVRADFVGIPPGTGELLEVARAHGWDAARALLDDTTTRWPQASVLREGTLNGLGYALHADHHDADAIAVLTEVARRYPSSTNAWDSLSEVLEATGATDDARAAAASGLAALAADASLAADQRAALDRSLRDRQARLAR